MNLRSKDDQLVNMTRRGIGLLTRSCLWHPKEDMVALNILTFHGPSPLWVWRPAGGVRSFSFPELMTALKHANIKVSERSPYYYVHFKEWNGADLDFTVEYSFVKAEEGERGIYLSHTALLRWESATDTVRFLADKPQ